MLKFGINSLDFIGWFGLFTILVVMIKNLLGLFLNFLSAKFSYDIFQYNSTRIYQSQIFLNNEIHSSDSSNLIHDISSISQTFSHSVLLPSLLLFNELMVVMVVFTLLLIYSASWFLLVFVVLGLNLAIVYSILKKKIKHVQEETNKCYPDFTKTIYDGIWGITDIRMTNSYSFFLNRYKDVVDLFSRLQIKNFVLVQFSSRYIETIVLSTIVIICLIMSRIGLTSVEMVTIFSILSIVAFRLLPSVNRIMIAVLSVNGGYFSLVRLKELGIEKIKSTPEENGLVHEEVLFQGEIKFSDISFRYSNNELILSKLNLSIHKGQCVGIVGTSGVGKSTFLKLLLGLITPLNGKITVDDFEISNNHATLNGWRSQIGFVKQDVFLRATTIAENIGFGLKIDNIEKEKLRNVIKLAGLESFIFSLPDKDLTQVGEDGAQLSGGQRQRIGIARALYQNPSILVLDEATSSLDVETETQIIETIGELKTTGITIVIVTHRDAMLKHCDISYEMRYGELLRK